MSGSFGETRKNRRKDQGNRIRILEINPHIYGHLVFDKGTVQWGKGQFSTNGTGKLEIHMQKLDPYLTTYIKINPKWIKNLNIRLKTVTLLEENIGQSFMTLDLTMIYWI